MVKMLVRSSGVYHMAAIHVRDPFSRFFGEFPCGDRI